MEKEAERQDGTAARAYRLVKKLLDDEERNARATLMVMRERSLKSPDASVRNHAMEHERMSKDRLKAVDEARKTLVHAFGRTQEGHGNVA